VKEEATYDKNGAEDAKAPCEEDIVCPAPVEVLQKSEEKSVKSTSANFEQS
jgi:hypothetical protein